MTLQPGLTLSVAVSGATCGCAFADSLPLSVVTGATVRYRLYSGWGLSAEE